MKTYKKHLINGAIFIAVFWALSFLGHIAIFILLPVGIAYFAALAVLDDPPLRSVEASVRVRLAGGARAGGLVWRYQDEDNYFLARLDLGVQDLALYRVVRGNRVRLEDEDDLELDPDAWYTLKVRHEGERIRIYLGGIKVIEEYDRSQPAAGRVGLWSADDSLGWFDDVRVGEGNGRRHEDSGR